MKNIFFVASLCALVFIHACTSSQQKQAVEQVNYEMLDSASVYDYNILTKYVATTEAFAYAKKLYLNGVDEAFNKKNPEASLPLFLQSLRLQPDPYTYLRYGDALYEVDSYDLALETYNIVGYFNNSEIDAEARFGRARCYAMQGENERALNTLESALSAFPFEKEKVEEEKAFENLKQLEGYKIIMAAFDNDELRLKKLLAIFSSNFPAATLPFNIGPDSLTINNGNTIDYRYTPLVAALNDGDFGREVSREFQYVAAVKLSPDYSSFIYRAVDYVADTMNPITYTLINIDTTGKILGEQEIACFCSPLTIKTLSIAADGLIEVKEIMQTWKEDPIYKGYEGNQIEKQEVKAVTHYKANGAGEIEELEEVAEDVPDYTKAPEVVQIKVH